MEIIAPKHRGIPSRSFSPFVGTISALVVVVVVGARMVAPSEAVAFGLGIGKGAAVNESLFFVRVVVALTVLDHEGVQECLGVPERLEKLFVDLLNVGNELVDVEGKKDERDEDDGGEADCVCVCGVSASSLSKMGVGTYKGSLILDRSASSCRPFLRFLGRHQSPRRKSW